MSIISELNLNEVSLALYYSEPPYDTKIAEIRQNDCELEITVLDQTVEKDVKKVINKIAKNQLQIPRHHTEEDKEGWTHYAEVKNVSLGEEDYLIGLYWAVLESGETLKGKHFIPRLLDEKGKVIQKYGRKLSKEQLKPLAHLTKEVEEL